MVLQVCKQLVGGFNTRFPAPLPICTSVLVVCAGCKVSETHLLDQKPTKQTQGVLRLGRFMLNRKNIWVIFNPIEEIFVNLDAFPIGRPGKHVPNSLSHHLVTWNLQSWILQNIIDTWNIFASPTNTQKCHQWIRVSISLGRKTLKGIGISLSKTLGIQNYEDMKDDLFQKDGP